MNSTTAALQKAYQLIRAGKLREARAILIPILRADQEIADAWYLLAHAVTDPEKKLVAFQEVLRLEPENLSAQKQVGRLLAARAQQKKTQKRQLGFGITVGILGFMATMTFALCLMTTGAIWWLTQDNIQPVAAAPLPTNLPASPTLAPTRTLTALPPSTATATRKPARIELQPADSTLPTALPAQKTPKATQESAPDNTTRLSAKYWREWPSVPNLSAKARDILQVAAQNPSLDLHAFSRVGDCQLTTGTFLGGYVTGSYPVPDGFSPTVDYFRNSFVTESITASNGLGVNSVLNPIFAAGTGHNECGADETPLDCELRIRKPAVVMVAMGTNWVPHAEVSYEKYLRMVVDRILETGALPILATKADNIEQDWKLNEAAAQVAYDYDLPLVNVWRSVQDLPNHGLESPKNIYLTGDAWMRRNRIWLETLDSVQNAINFPN